jgi:hypothetical protein
MKTNNTTTTTNKTQKPSQDIRNNSLFSDMTAQEEVFVQGGRFRAPELLFKPS